jgi:predicted phage baseplate assembly protein
VTVYYCCDENRRNAVRGHGSLNGIEFLEVLDDPALPDEDRQRTLFVHFVKPLAGGEAALTAENVLIEGGERVRNVTVTAVAAGTDDEADVLTVEVDRAGDFTPYTLRLVRGPNDPAPPLGYDPLLSAVEFSFKVDCGSDFDCNPDDDCPPEVFDEPDINYLAKDFTSFRQLMLDRMAVLAPGWEERSAADVGVMLVELLAYAGDYLSYYQDAVATEATLHTARRRVSVRRHARLLDYFMHDGCNTRTWVHFQTGNDGVPVPQGTPLLTTVPGLAPTVKPGTPAHRRALAAGSAVFETMHDVTLYTSHNEMRFYTWGDDRCCLPAGSTAATLEGHLPDLAEGDVLIFEERRGPLTGEPGDADLDHRRAVRLVSVQLTEDPLGGRFLPEPSDDPVSITEIRWMSEDALPFSLCISARVSEGDTEHYYPDVSVARGNVALADHGMTYNDDGSQEVLGPVPEQKMYWVAAGGVDMCDDPESDAVPVRFRPVLARGPLTCAAPYSDLLFTVNLDDPQRAELDAGTLPDSVQQAFAARRIELSSSAAHVSRAGEAWTATGLDDVYRLASQNGSLAVYRLPAAAGALDTKPDDALPAIHLDSRSEGDKKRRWKPVRDLLNSGEGGPQFVVEIDNEGQAALRFGDDRFGQRPAPGTTFTPVYRIGNGAEGNVGAESVAHVVTEDPSLSLALSLAVSDLGVAQPVRNPIPARGGSEPETMESVRQAAPVAFRTQERAVTAEDYAAFAMKFPGVQRAAATMRWTGSWYTVFITVDRLGGAEITPAFERRLRDFLEPYRMAGHDIEIDGPRYVPLEIEMTVCVKPGYFRSAVREALLAVFSDRVLPDGNKGLFHPDNFTFGQTIYLSPFYTAALAVDGVESVEISAFRVQDSDDDSPLADGKLTLGRLQIAQVENDPNYPKHGVFHLTLEGGK